MQKLHFVKMNGAGNDFVVLDNRTGGNSLDAAAIARLCDRHRGVGADGVLLVELPQNGHADFRMRYFNADGGEAEMCGNGARCFARFAAGLDAGGGGASRERGQLAFETQAGVIRARIEGEMVTVDMSTPHDGAEVGELLAAGETLARVSFLNTGVPHAVVPVENVEAVDVHRLGAAVRRHERFAPKGTNVNFYQALGPREITLRTFERGVEGETLACGTGATACALVFAEHTGAASPIAVRVREGATLRIGFERTGPFEFRRVTLSGPADFVFHGEIAR